VPGVRFLRLPRASGEETGGGEPGIAGIKKGLFPPGRETWGMSGARAGSAGVGNKNERRGNEMK